MAEGLVHSLPTTNYYSPQTINFLHHASHGHPEDMPDNYNIIF